MTEPVTVPAGSPAPRCYRHPDRETYVSCVRCGRPICHDCMRPASVGFQCPEEGSAPKVRTIGARPTPALVARAAPITTALIAINVVVFVVFVLNGSSFSGTVIGSYEQHVVQQGFAVATGGDWYRLFTAMFAHFGILHIGSNMLVLFFIGVPLERQLGPARFAGVYLVSGIGGGVATYLFTSPGTISAGASGAIFGLLGAYFVVARRMPTAQLGSVGGTILFNLIITFTIPGISITDHLGGLVVGGALGAVVGLEGRRPARTTVRQRALVLELAAFAAVLVVAVVLTAARTHELRDRYDRPAFSTGSSKVVASISPAAAAPAAPPPPRAA